MVKTFTSRVEEEMPLTGSYSSINVFVNITSTEDDNPVCRYGLRAYQMPSDIQPDHSISYIEDYALSTDGYKSSMIIVMGKKDKLLSFLRTEDLVEKLQADFKRLDKLLNED
jgi:hypothetical protein